MFDKNCIAMLREECIPLSEFAKQRLQAVQRIGHFKTRTSYIEHFEWLTQWQYLVFYIAKGNAILVQDKDYTALSEASTLLHSSHENFSVFLDDCEVYYAVLYGDHINDFIQSEYLLLDSRFSKKTEIFFHTIFQSLDKYHIIDEFSISSAVLRLYSDLHMETHRYKQESNKQDAIDRTITFIEQHYDEDIKLKNMAEESGYSEYYFLRVFKEAMLMTPYEYLTRKRLSQVKILLLSTDKTIEEIALLCGFKSDISLYKAFKNTYSITPREYKKFVCK